MRFERIDILRFGKFTDLRLDFPDAGLDFHLIVGANEAGKSTIRAAIADLLFGIEARSPYNFVHAYDEMRLAAVIRSADLRFEFHRLKRTKHPLRDAQDQPLRNDPLHVILGDMDRLSYERMFCLDHPRLVKGGDEILTARDDLARLLFEASSGITGFGRLRDALEEEARSLWDRRRSKDRAFHRALDELREAEQLLKDSIVRARDWAEIERRRQEAQEAFEAARRKHEQLEIRRARLERVRRVAPYLQKLRADLEMLGRLAETPRLPKGARDEVDRAEMDIATADALLAQAERALQETQRRIEEITVDQACIERAAEIEELERQRVQTQRYAADIEARRTELRMKLDELRHVARMLGWQEDEAALEQAIPPQPVSAAIRSLVQEHGRLAEALASSNQAVADKERELDALCAQLEQLSADESPVRLRAALAAAQSLGDPDRRIAAAQEQVRATAARLERELRQLAPWTGSLDELRGLVLPSDTEGREQQARDDQLASRLQAQREELQRLKTEVAIHEQKVEHLKETRQPVTRDALEAARRARDELWQELRTGRTTLSAGADELESRIRHADHLADLRYIGASDVASLEHEQAALVQARARLRRQEEIVAGLDAELAAHRSRWDETMRRADLPGLAPLKFCEWYAQRRICLQLADTLAEQEAELAALVEARARIESELRSSLGGHPDGTKLDDQASIAALIGCATERIRSIEARETQRTALLSQRRNAEATLAVLQARAERARVELAQWEERWSAQVAAASLPSGTTPAAAVEALDLCARVAELLKEIRILRRDRIEAMQRELEAFAGAAVRLARALAPELEQQDPSTISLELCRRLAAARRNAERLASAQDELERHRQEIERARRQKLQAQARIRPHMEHCGANSIAELRRAIERSEQLLELEQAIEASRRACLQAGDGLSLAQLEAELSSEDVATIEAQLMQIDEERARVIEQREELQRTISDCEAELRRYDGRADAAAAEARRQEALAVMAASAERFVKVFIAARLLRWAIDRYREDKQGPLLKRAGEIFSNLTRGSFERLTVDFEGKSPQLKGCRPGGKLVDVAGMSDGTRDQLYLALRLAALEMQLEQGRTLPFIADDLFINFDDERSAAGFEALAELATHTQVIFLTHHHHLLPIAEAAIGRPLNVTVLQA